MKSKEYNINLIMKYVKYIFLNRFYPQNYSLNIQVYTKNIIKKIISYFINDISYISYPKNYEFVSI